MGGSCSSNLNYVHSANDITSTDFSLYQTVGHGEFGKVFVGVHHGSGDLLAIKQIDLIKIWESGMKTTMIHNELNALRMIGKHPFTAELAFSLLDKGICYVALNLLEGGCLRDHMATANFCEQSVAFIIICIDSALRHIHSCGILHRDIKPANIVMDARGYPCLVDFGISFIRSRDDELRGKPLTCSMTSGTEAYCAPELLTRSHVHGIEAEYWSLGIMAYELIFGQRPFRRKVSSCFVKYIERIRERDRLKLETTSQLQESSQHLYTDFSVSASYSQSSKSGKSHSARTMNVGKSYRLTNCNNGNGSNVVNELNESMHDDNVSYVEPFVNDGGDGVVGDEVIDTKTEEELEDERMLELCHINIPTVTRWNTPVSSAMEVFLRTMLDARLDYRLGGVVTPVRSADWIVERNLPSIEELQRKSILPPPALAQSIYRHLHHVNLVPDNNCKRRPNIDSLSQSSQSVPSRAFYLNLSPQLSPRTKKIHSEIGEYNYVSRKYRRQQHSKS